MSTNEAPSAKRGDAADAPDKPSLEPAVQTRLDRIWRRAYDARTKDDLRALYADWAESYDEDHEAIGFFGHEVAADLLARYVSQEDVRPVLDAGAGTGAAGEALARRGFRNLTAIDLSPQMLERAVSKNVYAHSFTADLGEPLDVFPRDHFHAAILVGVFSYGQAPAHAIDEMLRVVEPGGVIVFTVRDDFFDEDAMGVRSRCSDLERTGHWRLLDKVDSAPYLPKKDPGATFHVRAYRVLQPDEPIARDALREALAEAARTGGNVLALDHAFIWNSTASRLYNRYTERPEYYLTDCEEEILRENAEAIVGDDRTIVELGCGSARKVRHLLEVAAAHGSDRPLRYLPIDVSPGAVDATRRDVERAFRERVEVEPMCGMFEDVLGHIPGTDEKLVLFFGSSIGNLDSVDETIRFLGRIRERLTTGDRFIVGVDLHKDEQDLLAAYSAGDENLSFFLNMVRRINDELGADFDLGSFHLAPVYEEEDNGDLGMRSWTVDLRIATSTPQHVYVRDLDLELHLKPGDAVQVGRSRKFRPEDVRRLAEHAGFHVERQWFDERRFFSLNELVPAESRGAAR